MGEKEGGGVSTPVVGGLGKDREREREESFPRVEGTSNGRVLCRCGKEGSFLVRRRGWGDGIYAGCYRGWEGFSAHGRGSGAGFPTSGVLSAG